MRSTSSGWMPLPVLPTLLRLGGEARSSLLPGLPIPPDSSVLLNASSCRSYKNICLVSKAFNGSGMHKHLAALRHVHYVEMPFAS